MQNIPIAKENKTPDAFYIKKLTAKEIETLLLTRIFSELKKISSSKDICSRVVQEDFDVRM